MRAAVAGGAGVADGRLGKKDTTVPGGLVVDSPEKGLTDPLPVMDKGFSGWVSTLLSFCAGCPSLWAFWCPTTAMREEKTRLQVGQA